MSHSPAGRALWAALTSTLVAGLVALAAALPLAAQSPPPPDVLDLYDGNGDGAIDEDELLTALDDHLAGRIGKNLARRVMELHLGFALDAIPADGDGVPDWVLEACRWLGCGPYAAPPHTSVSAPGSIDRAGEVDSVTFTAREGRIYRIDVVLGTLSDSLVELYDSRGGWLASNDNYGESRGSRLVVRVQSTGNLEVRVSGVGSAMGTYTLTILEVEDDHASVPALASRVPPGYPTSGSIEYAGDLDLFTFDAQEGQTYLVKAVPGTLKDAWVELHDSGGRPLAPSDGPGGSPVSHVALRAPATGQLLVGVGGYGSDTGTYTLVVLDIGDDHANSAADASFGPVGEPVPGTIEHEEDVDFFVFHGEEDEIYQIDVALGTLLDSQIGIFEGGHGRRLAFNDDHGDSRASRIFWEPSETGPVFLGVSGGGSDTGTYVLTVSDYEDDHGDSLADASPAPIGVPVPGTLEALEGVEYHSDIDFFVFDAYEGVIYQVEMSPGTLSYSEIDLHDSDGGWLAWNGDSGGSGPLRIFWRAKDTGELFAKVTGYGSSCGAEQLPRAYPWSDTICGGGTGTYTLTVSVADIEDDHANTIAGASPAAIGEPIPGTLDYEGDEDLFAFNVLKGVVYDFEVTLGTLPSTWTALHDGGKWDWYWNMDPLHPGPNIPGSSSASRTWRAEATGKAVVSVGGFYVSDTGSYTLTVTRSDIEDDHANGIEGASPAPLGESVHGSIQYTDDKDMFAFDTRDGEAYQIDAARGTLYGLWVELRSADGRIVDLLDGRVLDYNRHLAPARIVWLARETETMFVEVSGVGRRNLGDYILTVSLHEDDHGNDAASATHVTLDEPVSGSIHERGDVDLFVFEAREGETYLIDASAGTLYDLNIALSDGSGRHLALYDDYGFYGESRMAWRALETGMLFVEISGADGWETGTYTLTVSEQEDDHGNLAATARRVAIGEPVPGSIEYGFDEDIFAFDARRGEIYQIELALGYCCTDLTLRDGDGELIDFGYYVGSPPRERIIWRALNTGRLFVEVSSSDGRKAGGTYTLTVSIPGIEDDQGYDVASASPAPVGGAVPGSIDYPDDVDFFAFDAREGETYLVDVALGTLSDSRIELFREDGGSLAYSNDAGYANETPAPPIAWQAVETGRLFVGVRGWGTGTYTVTVSVQNDDHGNRRTLATGVTIGEPMAGSLEYGYDEDYFAFDALEGEVYQIDLALDTLSGCRISLHNSWGGWLARNDDHCGSPASRIGWLAPEAGRVFVRVRGVEGSDTGTYTLTVASPTGG